MFVRVRVKDMKSFISSAGVLEPQNLVLLVILFLAIVNSSFGLRPHQFSMHAHEGGNDSPTSHPKKEEMIRGNELGMDMYPTGSSLPDCSHACGPCFPCKRVMISFKCSVESCPIVYRCSCKGKYYHVPSN